jgi:sulfite reductase (ferredoxin)
MSAKLSGNEKIKTESRYLRGNITQELADSNAFVSDESYELLKFHGSYQGYNRDTATERKKQGLDKEWEFMLRMKLPAGRLTASQYLALDAMCDTHANGSLRITTRQTFQFHCIVKQHLGPFITDINRALLSTLGGCGDVVRNIITCPAPIKDQAHDRLVADSYLLAKHFAPRGGSHYDLFVNGEQLTDYPFLPLPSTPENPEPIYGDTYMPRKFKIALGTPEDNCMDALTNDLAILALYEDQQLKGYNIYVGGGLGMNHNNAKTYPRLASPIAFVKPEDFLLATEAVVKLQRDFGDRTDRKHARLKYVVEEKGLGWTKETLDRIAGKTLDAPKLTPSYAVEDHLGWHEQGDGKWFLGVPVRSGRIADQGDEAVRSSIRSVVKQLGLPIILTNDQNLIFADVSEKDKPAIEAELTSHGIRLKDSLTPTYRNSLACVSLPTCGKALAEAERIHHPLMTEIDAMLVRHGLEQEDIIIRIAGCPNGCSRPYVGDIGIVGRTPDHYAIYIGGDKEGTRLNEKILDKVPLTSVARALEPLLYLYKQERNTTETLSDYSARIGVASLKKQILDSLSVYPWGKA